MVVCKNTISLPVGNLGGWSDVVWHALCLDWTRRPLDLLVGSRHNHIGHNATDLLVFCLGDPTHFGCGVRPDPLRAGTRVLGKLSFEAAESSLMRSNG